MQRKRVYVVAMITAGAMILAACSSGGSGTATTSVAAAPDTTVVASTPSTTISPSTTDTSQAPTTTVPPALEASCNWDAPRLPAGDASGAPTSGEGDVAQAMLGAWQHVAINSGSGFEPLAATRDIRYVLAEGRFLYCQDVEGATDQAENSAPFTIEDSEIVLPSPASGYEVVAWNENTMVWRNLRDDSLYLLRRR